jgi:hypothetical protein
VTEIPDLGAIFGQQQPPRPSPAQAAHAAKVRDAVREAELAAYAQVQFFAPVLCGCDRRYDREDPRPPQLGCVVHGHLQLDHDGRILMFAPPARW